MNDGEALHRIIEALASCGVAHMLAGWFASTHHGLPRTTHDIDVVIGPTREELARFVASLDPGRFYVSAEAAQEAWRRRRQFEWARLGESERQLRDVRGVLEMQNERLDRGYIERWARELGVEELWRRIQTEARR